MIETKEQYFGYKKKCIGPIAQTIELAEEAKDTREMISVIIHGNKKKFLEEKNAKKVEIREQKDGDKNRPDFSDLLDL